MQQKIIIVAISILIGIALIAIGVFYVLRERQLTLYSNPDISQITINGQQKDFTQGMKVNFNQALTITSKLDGYQDFNATINPQAYHDSNYTIKLVNSLVDNSGKNVNDILRDAAQKDTIDRGLITNSTQLTVAVTSTKNFSDNYAVYTVEALDSNNSAEIILQKRSDGYHIVLGPGTNFQESNLAGLPTDLIYYLHSSGVTK